MKVIRYDGETALVEIYFAPGVLSKDVVDELEERLSLMLAEVSGESNVFLKKIFLKRDYFAVVAVENKNFDDVVSISSAIESRTKKFASQVKHSISSAINRI